MCQDSRRFAANKLNEETETKCFLLATSPSKVHDGFKMSKPSRLISVVVGLVLLLVCGAAVPSKDTVTVEKLLKFPKPLPRHLACFPNTNQLFVYHLFQKPNLVYHWSIKDKKVLKTYNIGQGYNCEGIKISDDGRFTLVASDSVKNFTTKVLLIDNQRKTVVRSIPIPGDISVVSGMEFSTNGQSFRLTINFQKTMCYDTTGTPVSGFDVPEPLKTTNQSVWVVENSKMTPMKEWGVYCRDEAGRTHRLHDNGPNGNLVVTGDNRYVAVGWSGELLIWRLSDGEQIFRKRLAKQSGFIRYDAMDNLILWADTDSNELLGIKIRLQMP